jgi:tRNA modification GTPase
VLDEALVLVFEAGASFTGEPSVELQIHGGTATVRAVLRALAAQPGLRLAEPGEFSRRALENGRMDLTQIEGMADLIDAETEAQRRQAIAVMSGDLGRKAQLWRADLVRASALLAVTIDFSDEDVPEEVSEEVIRLLSGVRDGVCRELAGAGAAERIKDGFEVAIVGAPNVGKSTLLNTLAGREAAITSDVAGTTRDVIEVRMEIEGLAVTLLDTAGLRESDDRVEQIGISRGLDRARRADLRIFLLAGDETLPLEPSGDDIVALAKADLRPVGHLAVSGKTGSGIDDLISRIGTVLGERVSGSSLVIRERQKLALSGALGFLDSAQAVLRVDSGVELAAAEVHAASVSLEMMIGAVGVEDLLEEIFSRFCIGK